jgi:hypothetical protein
MTDRTASMARFNENVAEVIALQTCAYCDGDIYAGYEVVVTYDNDYVHDACWRDYCDATYRDVYGVLTDDGGIT